VTPLSLEAPAKLNLTLRVVGRRADGYHLIDSELVLLDLADRLLLMPGATGLRVEAAADGEVPVGRENLAWRGLVAGYGGEPELAFLALEKQIPAGAGLGGGSSDAAAAWRLGRHVAGLVGTPSQDDLVALTRVGADVAFFAAALPAARVAGIGELVRPAALPPARFAVLAVPRIRLSTAAVFAEVRTSDLAEGHERGNDLLAPALRLCPELDDVMRAMATAGGEPRLSGSGTTVFTLTEDPERAAAIATRLSGGQLQVIETPLRRSAAEIVELDDAAHDAGAPLPSMG